MNYITLLTINVDNYPFQTWEQKFPNGKINLRSLCNNPDWDPFFADIEKKEYFSQIEKDLEKVLSKKKIILPYPDLTFNALITSLFNRIKFVILGQDPYFNLGKNGIPEACGLSFSVPYGFPRPSSLNNIYQNLIDFGHMSQMPKGGCLMAWVVQGCFMINSSFTTTHKNPNDHQKIWPQFTKDLLLYLNNNRKNLVFLAWGKNAHTLCLNIDLDKHLVIHSSHPSGYSYMSTTNGYTKEGKFIVYPSFKSVDHFGKGNQYLKSHNIYPIDWDALNI